MNMIHKPDVAFRPMQEADLAAVRELHARSFAALAADCHTPAEIAGHLALIAAPAYAEELAASRLALAVEEERIVATAGWIEVPDQARTARIRKVFVDPAMARRGLGSRMVRRAEDDARRAGHRRLIVRANLNAVPLYAALGYLAREEARMTVPGGISLPVVMMEKPFD
ncbi:MAG: GNAT family N-acetyltransferase [Alphaproteobacteria bacterium]